MGFSAATGIPYWEAIVKMSKARYLGETDSEKRGFLLRNNFMVLPDSITGKNIVLIDEAIFTGETLRLTCEMLRRQGVNTIQICIPTSPCILPCALMPQQNLLAARMSIPEMRSYLNADALCFQTSEIFREQTMCFGDVCTQCFQ